MTYTIVADKSVDEVGWKRTRLEGCTATDVATLARAGADGRASLLAEKLGKGKNFGGNAFTEHGHGREGFIAKWAENRFALVPCSYLIASDENPRHMASPDALGNDEGGEYKTTSKPWPTHDDIPGRYFDQCQWGMHVAGKEQWLFAWEEHENFVPRHMEPQSFWIPRDEKRIAELVAIADDFLAEMDAPYQPTRFDDLVAEFVSRRAVVLEAQAELAEVDAQIREALADSTSERAITPFGNLTWSTPKPRVTFDSKAFQSAQPDIYQQFLKETQAKPSLRITAPKET